MNTIGENIKMIREKRDLTQDELAEIARVHRVTLAKYESGKSVPGADVLGRLSQALHVKADTLLGFDDEELSSDHHFSLDESELLTIYRDLNDNGQTILLNTARGLSANPEMKEDSASNTATA